MQPKQCTVGFLSAPNWFDPAPHEFPSVVREDVVTQQAPLILPDFDYTLESIASVQNHLGDNALCLKQMGCDIVAQVGSPFSWAKVRSERDARVRCDEMEQHAGVPVIMTGLAIIDSLRAHGVSKVAADCTYYDAEWADGFSSFLAMCGFKPEHVSTLSEQGLGIRIENMHDFGWSMDDDLTMKSILFVADMSPDSEAIVVTGAGTRTLGLLDQLEARTGKVIVAADTAVYWAVARAMRLTLLPVMGRSARV